MDPESCRNPASKKKKIIITHPGFSGWIPLLGGDFHWIIHHLIYGPHTTSNNPPLALQLKGPEHCHIPEERASSLGNCLWNAPTGSTVPIDEGALPLSKKLLETKMLIGERWKGISEVHVTQENMQYIHASTICPLHALNQKSSEPSRFILLLFNRNRPSKEPFCCNNKIWIIK